MYKAVLNTKQYTAKTKVFNVVTSCSDATVTATNSASAIIGQTTAPSGGTGNIPISNSVISNTTGVINNLPATTPLTIVDSVVSLVNTANDPLSTSNVPATTNLTLTAPNSTTNVEDQLGNPLGTVTGISGATNTQTVTVPPCPDLDALILSSTSQEVVDGVNDANKAKDVFNLLSVPYGAGLLLTKDFGTAATNVLITVVAGNELGLLNQTANAFVQWYSLPDRVLLRTKTGLGAGAASFALSADGTQYLVAARISNQTYIVSRVGDNITATLTTTNVVGAAFAPNGNVFFTPLGGNTVTELTQANTTVGATFTIPNVPQVRGMQRNGNDIWAFGDTGSANVGRISFFDATTRAITNFTISGTAILIGRITGMAFISTGYVFAATIQDSIGVALVQTDFNGNMVQERIVPIPVVNNTGISAYNGLPNEMVFLPQTTLNRACGAII